MRQLSALAAALVMALSTVVIVPGQAEAATSPSVNQCLVFRPVLSLNTSQHACTAALQGFLRATVSSSLAIDGIFGPATQKATIKYQTVRGLTADGVVGGATWKAIDKDCANGGPIIILVCATQWPY